MTETRPEREKSPRLLAALEGQFRPKRYHREATLRPSVPLPANVTDQVTRMLPRWDWQARTLPRAEEMVYLDGNGAWIAAASSVRIGMEQLERTGRLDVAEFAKERRPGYYQVRMWHAKHASNLHIPVADQDPALDLFSWSDPRFVSPLGQARDGFIWMCEPTLALLVELERKDQWGTALSITDSWTAETKTDLRDWTQWVDAQRLELKSRPGAEGKEQREIFKLRYAQAVQMLGGAVDKETGRDKCLVRRPDWYHAIVAQHRANQWRKVWNAVQAGVEVVRVGGNDEVHVTGRGYEQLLAMQSTRPPLRLDETALGAYDVKKPLGAADEKAA